MILITLSISRLCCFDVPGSMEPRRGQGRDGGYWPFTDQDLGGDRQFHLVWWQALGGISAEEHAHIFLDEP